MGTFVHKQGEAAIRYANMASWWEWQGGSALFYWRWPEEFLDNLLFGVRPIFHHAPPQVLSHQSIIKDKRVFQQVKQKVKKVVHRGYIELTRKTNIHATMYMFQVSNRYPYGV
mmetsp:Transcript_12347/g.17590  ORF Transcript_12347/g.17590 Transcript_12347/m.17590 type:complete len:113 (+) Transcript_12347:2055-2393(+)